MNRDIGALRKRAFAQTGFAQISGPAAARGRPFALSDCQLRKLTSAALRGCPIANGRLDCPIANGRRRGCPIASGPTGPA